MSLSCSQHPGCQCQRIRSVTCCKILLWYRAKLINTSLKARCHLAVGKRQSGWRGRDGGRNAAELDGARAAGCGGDGVGEDLTRHRCDLDLQRQRVLPRPIGVVVWPLVVDSTRQHQPGATNVDTDACDGHPAHACCSDGLLVKDTQKGGGPPVVGHDEGEPVVGADHNIIGQRAIPHIAGHAIPLHLPAPIAIRALVQRPEQTLWAPAYCTIIQNLCRQDIDNYLFPRMPHVTLPVVHKALGPAAGDGRRAQPRANAPVGHAQAAAIAVVKLIVIQR